jgi:hypothetical protein
MDTPMNRQSARRRMTRRGPVTFEAPAEILETRQLLSGIPFLAFAVPPSNAIAGHSMKFTVDAMINVKTATGTVAEVDTAFSGTCAVVAIGPGTFDTPYNFVGPQGPNSPYAAVMMPFVNGVAADHHRLVSIDVAGTYQLSAVGIATPPNVNAAQVLSNKFTISPFTATDRLVFLNAPSTATVGAPISVTVAAEDQFGNVDTSLSNVSVNLLALPGNLSTAQLNAGEATFNDAFFVAAGPDTLLAFASPPTGGVLVGTDVVQVFRPNGG